jgi:selenocysteine lyase/cysteine desulfurase
VPLQPWGRGGRVPARPDVWRKAARARIGTVDQYLAVLRQASAGALRASFGLASNVEDAERLVEFIEMTYRDRVVGTSDLLPRRGC